VFEFQKKTPAFLPGRGHPRSSKISIEGYNAAEAPGFRIGSFSAQIWFRARCGITTSREECRCHILQEAEIPNLSWSRRLAMAEAVRAEVKK
jgi:hypothetical protein